VSDALACALPLVCAEAKAQDARDARPPEQSVLSFANKVV